MIVDSILVLFLEKMNICRCLLMCDNVGILIMVIDLVVVTGNNVV